MVSKELSHRAVIRRLSIIMNDGKARVSYDDTRTQGICYRCQKKRESKARSRKYPSRRSSRYNREYGEYRTFTPSPLKDKFGGS